ncbi:hypothetical protein PGT21_015050 [Puccinia graminis f. sp. tritici]|uniref:Uncharacterized protein n=1 Tax=Puccinia graminis f. sp. tritici TaxID=56615 RepID=A0A5B0QWF4_PUCGR|nr:hypothetical protein PGT21_015050 [Puccinia graminis f. sp. tritici]KAA1118611.1 hypothetical protein PGTUg99_001722 [Puccinia graminis f. sp. tritici]
MRPDTATSSVNSQNKSIWLDRAGKRVGSFKSSKLHNTSKKHVPVTQQDRFSESIQSNIGKQ